MGNSFKHVKWISGFTSARKDTRLQLAKIVREVKNTSQRWSPSSKKFVVFYVFTICEVKMQTKTVEKICEVYGPDTITIRAAQRWFDRFRSVVVDVEDTPPTGRQIVVETDKIVEIIQIDRHVSICSIGQELGIERKTFRNHLQKIGFQKKLDVWVAH